MAQYSDLDPTRCRPSVSDGTNLKPSLTTSGYSGGTPTAATDLKRSIVYPDGTLKQSIADATDLKRCMLKPGGERSQYLGGGIQDNNIAKHIRGENGNGKAPVDDGYYLDTATAAGGLKVTTLQQKFGTGSLDFDGTDDELTFSGTTALESTSSDCTTWECWIRPTTVTGNDGIFMMQDGTDYIELFREGTAITVQAYISLSEVVYITGGTITINQWHHVRVRRNATFFKLFVNGIEIGTDTDSNTFGGTSWTLTVGNGFTSGFWQGQIDEFLVLDQICLGAGKPTSALTPATTAAFYDYLDCDTDASVAIFSSANKPAHDYAWVYDGSEYKSAYSSRSGGPATSPVPDTVLEASDPGSCGALDISAFNDSFDDSSLDSSRFTETTQFNGALAETTSLLFSGHSNSNTSLARIQSEAPITGDFTAFYNFSGLTGFTAAGENSGAFYAIYFRITISGTEYLVGVGDLKTAFPALTTNQGIWYSTGGADTNHTTSIPSSGKLTFTRTGSTLVAKIDTTQIFSVTATTSDPSNFWLDFQTRTLSSGDVSSFTATDYDVS
jgi:hypothetical protein